ncbi:MAG TPA: hypothetical protein VK061_08865 [Bacillota bacterium]|nr:hypothetical protein [Bacillota bacterium]
MLGLLVTDMEKREIEYLIKREFEEILLDLEDHRIDDVIKESMIERYKVLFNLFRKVATEEDCLKYMLQERNYNHR